METSTTTRTVVPLDRREVSDPSVDRCTRFTRFIAPVDAVLPVAFVDPSGQPGRGAVARTELDYAAAPSPPARHRRKEGSAESVWAPGATAWPTRTLSLARVHLGLGQHGLVVTAVSGLP